MKTSFIPAFSAILVRDDLRKKFMCSSGATGFSEFLDPFGAFQSMIFNRRSISLAVGTLILSTPSVFKDFFR